MTKRFSTALIAGLVAGSMLATAALAQPAPGGTSLTTTPAELRTTTVKTVPAVEKPVQVQPAKSVAVKKPVKAKKAGKKVKGAKKVKAAPKAEDNSSSVK